jgi:hypothetical protein
MKKMNTMRFIEINKRIEDFKVLKDNESTCDNGV